MIRGNALCLLVNKILAITCWVLRRLNIIVFSVKFRNQMRNKTQESLLIFPHGAIRPKCIFSIGRPIQKRENLEKAETNKLSFFIHPHQVVWGMRKKFRTFLFLNSLDKETWRIEGLSLQTPYSPSHGRCTTCLIIC